MNEKLSAVQPIESREEKPKGLSAVVFVPGLGESALAIYKDVSIAVQNRLSTQDSTAERAEDTAQTPPMRYFAVSTHPNEESAQQLAWTNKAIDAENTHEAAPIMCVASDEELANHTSFEHRIALTEQALTTAAESGAREITLVGHSAGGLASLAAVARRVQQKHDAHLSGDTNQQEVPIAIHAVLIAPAVPGEASTRTTVEWPFIRTMLADLVRKQTKKGSSYVKNLLTGHDITPNRDDLQTILGPMEDNDYAEHALDHAVPISGGEGLDLLRYPRVLGDIKQEDWPEDLSIDVIIPDSDRWVSQKGQEQIVAELLSRLAGDKANVTHVPGGHMPLGEKEQALEKILDIIVPRGDH